MEPLTLLFIVGAVLIIGFFIKAAFKVFKFLSLISTIVSLLLIIPAFFVLQDLGDFKDTWPNSTKLVIIEDTTGVIAMFEGTLTEQGEPVLLDNSEYNQIKASIDSGRYDPQYYKTLIVHMDAFRSVKAIEVAGFSFEKFQVVRMLRDEEYLRSVLPVEDTDEARLALMVGLLNEGFNENPLFIVSEYKSGSLKVLPTTALFTFLEYLPDFLIESVINKKDLT